MTRRSNEAFTFLPWPALNAYQTFCFDCFLTAASTGSAFTDCAASPPAALVRLKIALDLRLAGFSMANPFPFSLPQALGWSGFGGLTIGLLI